MVLVYFFRLAATVEVKVKKGDALVVWKRIE